MTLLAVDPGLRNAGVALFSLDGPNAGQLIHAQLIKNPAQGDGPNAWFALGDHAYEIFKKLGHRIDVYAVEVMQVYKGNYKNPNDLIQVAACGAAIGAALPIKEAHGYYPREWKGNVPKAIHNERTMNRISEAEKKVIQRTPGYLMNNVIDAIGIGLFHLERTRVRIA